METNVRNIIYTYWKIKLFRKSIPFVCFHLPLCRLFYFIYSSQAVLIWPISPKIYYIFRNRQIHKTYRISWWIQYFGCCFTKVNRTFSQSPKKFKKAEKQRENSKYPTKFTLWPFCTISYYTHTLFEPNSLKYGAGLCWSVFGERSAVQSFILS